MQHLHVNDMLCYVIGFSSIRVPLSRPPETDHVPSKRCIPAFWCLSRLLCKIIDFPPRHSQFKQSEPIIHEARAVTSRLDTYCELALCSSSHYPTLRELFTMVVVDALVTQYCHHNHTCHGIVTVDVHW